MQRARNPILNNLNQAHTLERSESATYLGIGIKTGLLLLATILSGAFAWILLLRGDAQSLNAVGTILGVAGITAFIAVLIASFVPRVAMPFSILYAVAQGFSLGTLTFMVEEFFAGKGIAISALIATVIIFGVMLTLYSSRTVRATNRLRKIMYVGIISILVFSIVGAFFPPVRLMFVTNPLLGILVSLGLILYGAFMLVLNFDQAEMVVNNGLPKNFEWSVSLGLMITLIWIYVEVIRLLVIIFANRE